MSMPSALVSRTLIVLLFTCFFGGCSSDTHPAISVAVTPQAASIAQLSQTFQFTAKAQLDHVPGLQDVTQSVTWTSSNPAVAKIDPSGVATAVSSGTTTLTATAASGASGS